MKVTGTSGLAPSANTASRASAAAPGFAAGESRVSGGAAQTAHVSSSAPVASMDALLALQEAESPLERRRRAVKRAGRLLDALDEVKLAMLGGESSAPALQRLAQAAREQRGQSDDAGLTGVLDEIETRAAVELAKAEMSRLAA